MAYLLIPDKKQMRKIPLKKTVFFIGRAHENDLIIPSDSLSRFHAQIQRKGDQYMIEDRGSLNGVSLNGTRIYKESALRDGDIIGFGDVYTRFCLEEAKPLKEKERSSQQMQRFPISDLVDSKRFEPEKRQRYLELLYNFSTTLLQQFPSSDLSEVVLDAVQQVWNPDRSCIMFREPSGEWQIGVQRFGKNPQLTGDTIEISTNLIRELEKEEEAVLISHRTEDQRFSASESLQRQNVHSLICAPLWNKKKIHGFLYGDLIFSNRSFTYADLEMFAILGNLMAIKSENDQLWHQALIQQQLEHELNLAADIQRKFFPAQAPEIPGYDVDAITIPTRKVGGDAYFWHERNDGSIVLMIADVMGKGLPSSLLMSQIQAIMKIFSEQYQQAADIVRAVNEFIYKYSTQEKFISMVVIVLFTETGKMSYCNAGHNAPFLLNGSPQMLEKGGTLVGVFPDQPYQQGEAVLQPGGVALLYTDGLIEARNHEDEEFGVPRLMDLVQSNRTRNSRSLADQIVREIREKWLGTDQEDDWTLLVVKRN